jgi:hypothetical protein
MSGKTETTDIALCGDCGGPWHGGDTECPTRTTPRRDWILVYVREGDPAYWVATDGELRVPSDVPPREEWAPEMQDCQL